MTILSSTLAAVLVIGIASWFITPSLWATVMTGVSRRAAGQTSRFRSVGGIRWHYLHGGRGPTVLLLHGFGANGDCWLRLAKDMRRQFSVLIPDLPGFGESEPPQQLRFDIDTQVERLLDFLDAIGVEPCIVVGNSMGGYVATALAAKEPERVTALWLMAPLGTRSVEPGDVLNDIDKGHMEYLQINSIHQFRKRVIPTMFCTQPWIPGPIVNTLTRRAMAHSKLMPEMLRQVRFDSKPLEEYAQRVRQPVLLQWGEDDKVVSPAGLAALEALLEDVTTTLTKQCGHLAMLEKPGESERQFKAFLSEKRLD